MLHTLRVIAAICLMLMLASSLHAQDIPGFNSGNYGGVSSIDLQPAAIADSRYKFDMTVAGAGFAFSNNIFGINRKANITNIYKRLGERDFTGKYIKSYTENNETKRLYAHIVAQAPSFMVNVTPKIALAFTARVRTMFNIDNLTPQLARIAYNGNKDTKYWNVDLNNDGVAINSMLWAEYGIGYGQVIKSGGPHFLKGGGRVKFLPGVEAGYFYGRNLNYKWADRDNLNLFTSELGYGHSDNYELNAKGIKINRYVTKPALGLDLGFVYEWRPDHENYVYEMDGVKGLERRDQNKYKIRAGVSLVDLGRIRFTKSRDSRDFQADIRNWNLKDIKLGDRPVQAFDDTLRRRFTMDTAADEHFNMVLPTALSFQVDFHIHQGFYVNLVTYNGPNFFKDEHRLNALSYYMVTPRWESKWFGAYLPISLTGHEEFRQGLTLRAGPFVIGTADISPLFYKKFQRSMDLHVAFKIPLFAGSPPRDRDMDMVSDKMDQCPDQPGPWAQRGCGDRDGDSVVDRDDKCPDIKGAAASGGCPDRDGDGVLDDKDNCPDERGYAHTNGCPDSDADSIIDRDDKCPQLAGPARNMGCPDRDGDGVHDGEDRCPDSAGPRANSGCPSTDDDGDGVPDKDDKCPKTPGPKENGGCPSLDKSTRDILDSAYANLQFEKNSDVILSGSYPSLDRLADLLRHNPLWKLKLSGHTDNSGAEPANKELSRQRALAVQTYLAGKGVARTRVTVEYFGSTKPLVPNTSEANRAKNRRVEMKLRFE